MEKKKPVKKKAKVGIVYLVGAGPGDPELLTLRGAALLKQAEVVVYDALASPALLGLAAENAEIIYAGKRSHKHYLRQDETNRLLVKLGKSKRVVRLKGGDPYMFGRGGEEVEALAAAGVPFEVVPGITSALAAPAYAGIPLTHRAYASQVTIVTGQRREDAAPGQDGINYRALAEGGGTLVFLMGMENLLGLVRGLINAGLSEMTPAAVVQWGTTGRQRQARGTLSDIARKVEEQGLGAPAIIVVGGVVGLSPLLNWFEKQPLFGARIVITRSRRRASELAVKLKRLGAWVVEYPTIAIRPLKKKKNLCGKLTGCDWLVLTSAEGVEVFFAWLRAEEVDCRILSGIKVCAIGPGTAGALEKYGIRADLVPSVFQAEGILKALPAVRGRRIILARSRQARTLLYDRLKKAGALVEELPLYETGLDSGDREMLLSYLRTSEVDYVTFTSSSTVENLLSSLAAGAKPALAKARLASIGPITGATMKKWGLKVAVSAKRSTLDGLVDAMVNDYQKRK